MGLYFQNYVGGLYFQNYVGGFSTFYIKVLNDLYFWFEKHFLRFHTFSASSISKISRRSKLGKMNSKESPTMYRRDFGPEIQ